MVAQRAWRTAQPPRALGSAHPVVLAIALAIFSCHLLHSMVILQQAQLKLQWDVGSPGDELLMSLVELVLGAEGCTHGLAPTSSTSPAGGRYGPCQGGSALPAAEERPAAASPYQWALSRLPAVRSAGSRRRTPAVRCQDPLPGRHLLKTSFLAFSPICAKVRSLDPNQHPHPASPGRGAWGSWSGGVTWLGKADLLQPVKRKSPTGLEQQRSWCGRGTRLPRPVSAPGAAVSKAPLLCAAPAERQSHGKHRSTEPSCSLILRRTRVSCWAHPRFPG